MNQAKLIAKREIEEIRSFDLPELLEKLPVNGFEKSAFTLIGEGWAFTFMFASPSAHFAANGTGATPREAYAATVAVLQMQIEEWHRLREITDAFSPQGAQRKPVVMIVDDDVDVAHGMELIFKELGCDTRVVTEPTAASHAISFQEADFIILDWKLARDLEGADVLRRANRLIDSLSDLRTRFGHRQPKVITHSVLERGDINVPSSQYFQHMDHWQKPLRFDQLVQRGGAVLDACGF